MKNERISKEQIERVLAATYQYWDGYYLPDEDNERDLLTEIYKEVNDLR